MRSPTSSRTAVAVVALVTLSACTDEAPVGPAPTGLAGLAGLAGPAGHVTTETNPTDGPWARVIEGTTGSGALYAVHVPRDWNGDAVVYAHGFRDAWSPVDLRDQDNFHALRDQLGARGFAVAYSSYSENGFAVKDGAQRTHQLRGRLAEVFGRQPTRTFLAGHSLGAGIALALAERYPAHYDGALLMCGMVGGSRLQTQYLGDVRALFDHYFPGGLPGDALSYPAGQTATMPQVTAAVQSNPVGLFAIASTMQTPLPFVPAGDPTNPATPAFQTMAGSLYGALNFHSRGIANLLDLTHGHTPFGNSGTTYTLGTAVVPALAGPITGMIEASNTGVARFTIARSAEKYLERNFTPTGDLQVPVLTVHNVWDPGVPAFHERELLRKVTEAGATGMLRQRYLPTYGHCAIPTATAVQGMTDLVAWATTGAKPVN